MDEARDPARNNSDLRRKKGRDAMCRHRFALEQRV